MHGVQWLDFVLRDLMVTWAMLYTIFIDSYQISHRLKTTMLLLIILWTAWHAICVLNRILTFDPTQTWDDYKVELQLPFVRVPVSLQSMMLNALVMFLLFMLKQLYLMIKYPNRAVFQLYPDTAWTVFQPDPPMRRKTTDDVHQEQQVNEEQTQAKAMQMTGK